MNQTASTLNELIRRARAGDREALGDLLEQHRAYLRVLTDRKFDKGLGQRLDASDVVQQTFLSAYKRFSQFAGQVHPEFLAWLQHVHDNNLRDAVRRHVQAEKRAVGREQRLSDVPEAALAEELRPTQRVLLSEDSVRLAQALEHLPDDQKTAVRLRYLEGWTLAELSSHLERSEDAVASLIKRGIRKLRQTLSPD